jgi:hypothetical protein
MTKILMVGPPNPNDLVFQSLISPPIMGNVEVTILDRDSSAIESLSESLQMMGVELDYFKIIKDHKLIKPLAQSVTIYNSLNYSKQTGWFADERVSPYGLVNLPGDQIRAFFDEINKFSHQEYHRERIFFGMVAHTSSVALTTSQLMTKGKIGRIRLNSEMDSWEILDYMSLILRMQKIEHFEVRILASRGVGVRKRCDFLIEHEGEHIEVVVDPHETSRIEFDAQGVHYTYRIDENQLLLKNKIIKERPEEKREQLFGQQFTRLIQKQLHAFPSLKRVRPLVETLLPILGESEHS